MRANEGWGFIKVGGVYQYKEEGHIAIVKVLADESDGEYYRFKLQAIASDFPFDKEFGVVHIKTCGYYNDMIQFYETMEYMTSYTIINDKEAFEASIFSPKGVSLNAGK